MADTRVQAEVEEWIRSNWLPGQFGQTFSRADLPLASGGSYPFNAVSADRRIVAAITTSGARTASGKLAVGKLLKIRSELLFLHLAQGFWKIVVLSEPDMLELCQREQERGRVPGGIEFRLAEIPPELAGRLRTARAAASEEVTPE